MPFLILVKTHMRGSDHCLPLFGARVLLTEEGKYLPNLT